MLAEFSTHHLCSGGRPRPNLARHRPQSPALCRFLEGPKAVLEGRYGWPQALILICSTLPALLGLVALTLPGILFPTEAHRAYYHFACNLANDPLSLLPFAIGAVTIVLGLRVPLR